jgi:hypothetical protein
MFSWIDSVIDSSDVLLGRELHEPQRKYFAIEILEAKSEFSTEIEQLNLLFSCIATCFSRALFLSNFIKKYITFTT